MSESERELPVLDRLLRRPHWRALFKHVLTLLLLLPWSAAFVRAFGSFACPGTVSDCTVAVPPVDVALFYMGLIALVPSLWAVWNIERLVPVLTLCDDCLDAYVQEQRERSARNEGGTE